MHGANKSIYYLREHIESVKITVYIYEICLHIVAPPYYIFFIVVVLFGISKSHY